MFFRKKKKRVTQIYTFQDQSSGWDSGPVKPPRRSTGELYEITFEMMKKGSVHTRGSKKVRQFGVMVGTDLRLVTSGDKVDRDTYEALLAVDAIEPPNRQMNIPGIAADISAPPPRPAVAEAMEHVNPVHHEVVGLASVRPMRRKTDPDVAAPRDRREEPAPARASAPHAAVPRPVIHAEGAGAPREARVVDMPAEEKLEALDRHIAPVGMPPDAPEGEREEALPPVDLPGGVEQEAEAFDLPPDDLPGGVDQEAEAFDLPPDDLPGGVDQEVEAAAPIDEAHGSADAAEEASPAETPRDAAAAARAHDPGQVQTELMELLGEDPPAHGVPAQAKHGKRQAAKKKRGKRKR